MVWHTLVLVSNHVWLLERNRSKSLDHGPAWTSSMLKLQLVHFGLFSQYRDHCQDCQGGGEWGNSLQIFYHIFLLLYFSQGRGGKGAQWANPGHYKKVKVDQNQNRMQVYAKKLYFTWKYFQFLQGIIFFFSKCLSWYNLLIALFSDKMNSPFTQGFVFKSCFPSL